MLIWGRRCSTPLIVLDINQLPCDEIVPFQKLVGEWNGTMHLQRPHKLKTLIFRELRMQRLYLTFCDILHVTQLH